MRPGTTLSRLPGPAHEEASTSCATDVEVGIAALAHSTAHAAADVGHRARREVRGDDVVLKQKREPALSRRRWGCGAACARGCLPRRLPRTAALCRLLAALVGLAVAFHAASCGYFFCVRFPGRGALPRDLYDDVRDLYLLSGGPRWAAQRSALAAEPDATPKLIPRIIHQTYRSTKVPAGVRPFMASWRALNPEWEYRFYDDEACARFVAAEFPEYAAAYRALPKNVERSDFFRYMVVLRLGGVYSDMDTECVQPMDALIRPRDTLLVSWENEFHTAAEAAKRKYVRKRQVLQWTFAAAPGHPALREMCDHIAANVATLYSEDTNRATLERTGPGAWTDVILRHAALHPPAQVLQLLKQADDPWSVRVLPKVAFGVHPLGLDGVSPDDPDVAVLHHFLGSWKARGGWGTAARRKALARWLASFNPFGHAALSDARTAAPPGPSAGSGVEMEDALPYDAVAKRLYPVSVSWAPPFTMWVDLVGHGLPQAGVDVAATLTAWGKWQPALAPMRGPTVADALVGSLGGKAARPRVLLDIGAGSGYFALAAAARGHAAIAIEVATGSVASFNASIHYNGFASLITLHQVALGAEEGAACVARPSGPGFQPNTDFERGYGPPAAHALDAPLGPCLRTARRRVAAALVPPGTSVGAVRVSAAGWEGWVLDGLQDLVARDPPGVVLVELHPSAVEASGYPGGALRLLQTLHAWGYTDVSHSGHVCDERFHNITRAARLRGAMTFAAQEALRQPTWCLLPRGKFGNVVARASATAPENVLFIYKGEKGDRRAAVVAAAGPNASGAGPAGLEGMPQAPTLEPEAPGPVARAAAIGSWEQGRQALPPNGPDEASLGGNVGDTDGNGTLLESWLWPARIVQQR